MASLEQDTGGTPSVSHRKGCDVSHMNVSTVAGISAEQSKMEEEANCS